MKEVTFSAGLTSKLKSVFTTTVTIGLLTSLTVIALGGNFSTCYALIQLIFAITAIAEGVLSVSFKLSVNGITVNSPLRHETFLFNRYNVFRAGSKGKHSLHFVSKNGKRSVYIKCRSYSTAQFDSLMSNIKLYRGTDAEDEPEKSVELPRQSAPTSKPVTPKHENPESEPIKTAQSSAKYEPTKPIIATVTQEPVKSAFESQEPKTPNEPAVPQVPDQRANGEISDEPIVFRYPRRAVIEAAERAGVMIVLSLLMLCASILLVLALTVPLYPSVIIAVLIVFAVLIAAILLYRIPKTRNLPSKLELTDELLIIDNDRYRFSKLTDCRMTPIEAQSGIRRICFNRDDKRIICNLGPVKKPSGKRRADEYFDRYGELCRILAKHGFK